MSILKVNQIMPHSGNVVEIVAGTLSTDGVSILTINVTASGDISASGTIYASKFESAGASNEVIAFNDNLNVTGHITASGNISSSGTIFANNFKSTGNNVSGIDFSDDINVTGQITASGNVSASGNLIGKNLIASGEMTASELIVTHDHPKLILNTTASYGDPQIRMVNALGDVAGFIRLAVTDHTASFLSIGSDNSEPNSQTSLEKHLVLSSSGTVGIGTITPTAKLHVAGNIWASGSTTPGNVTASGNISASGTAHVFGGYITGDGGGTGVVGISDHLQIKSEHPRLDIRSSAASGDQAIKFKSGDGSTMFTMRSDVTSNTANHFALGNGTNDTQFVLDANGKIGMGIQAPASQLHVVGDIFATSHVSASGTVSASFIRSNTNIATVSVSASGDISGSNLLAENNITVGTDIIHKGDTNTKFTFGADAITLTAGGANAIVIGSSGLTTLTAGGNLDIGAHDLRAATLTADGLTPTRVVFAGTNGVLSDDADLTFATDTLTVTKIANVNSTSHVTASGNISSSGTISGNSYITDTQTIAAAGNALANATAVDAIAGTVFVTSDDAAKGVRLPAVNGLITGSVYTLYNTSAVVLEVYPTANDRIFPLADDAPASVPANASITVTSFSTAGWQGFFGTVIS